MEETTVQDKKQEDTYKTIRHVRSTMEPVGSNSGAFKECDDYFEYVSYLYYVVIILGVTIFEVFCFQTNLFPFERLGGPGRRLLYLATNHMTTMRAGFLITIILHIFEAAYAHYQCRSNKLSHSATRKWMIQTFIVGYASLRLLNGYFEKRMTGKKTS